MLRWQPTDETLVAAAIEFPSMTSPFPVRAMGEAAHRVLADGDAGILLATAARGYLGVVPEQGIAALGLLRSKFGGVFDTQGLLQIGLSARTPGILLMPAPSGIEENQLPPTVDAWRNGAHALLQSTPLRPIRLCAAGHTPTDGLEATLAHRLDWSGLLEVSVRAQELALCLGASHYYVLTGDRAHHFALQ